MELSQIFGYAGALVIGVVLGLIGGGGSILTVPVLVYLFYVNPVTATAYSLFVVGVSALVGAVRNIQKGLVDFKTAIVFAIPAFIAVYATRKFIVPAIPEELFEVNGFLVTKNIAIMVFFAIIMLVAAISMIKSNGKKIATETKVKYNYPLIIVEGIVVGLLTGIVGAGGGFLVNYCNKITDWFYRRCGKPGYRLDFFIAFYGNFNCGYFCWDMAQQIY